MNKEDVQVGKWYTTNDWMSEPSMCKAKGVTPITDSNYCSFAIINTERVLKGKYISEECEDPVEWCYANGAFIEASPEFIIECLPEDHPDRIMLIPDIKELISGLLGIQYGTPRN